jgi:RNA 2',3'-cyclic 3'-phosphodiesterase
LNRLFVAVWPPPELIEQLRRLDRPARPGLRWTTEDQWHVTLRFLGDVAAPVEEEALRGGLAGVAAVVPALEAVAGPHARPLGPVWVLPVAGLDHLAGRIGVATSEVGRPPAHRSYRGHLTLARAKHRDLFRGLPQTAVAGAWTVTEVTLVRSHLGSTGARYDIVGRWPLVDQPR